MLKKTTKVKLTNPKKIYKHETVDCAIATGAGAKEFSTRIEDVLKTGIRLFTVDKGAYKKGQRVQIKYYRDSGKYLFMSEIKTVVPVADRFLIEILLPTKIKKL